jgi:uncharacterized membrane protein
MSGTDKQPLMSNSHSAYRESLDDDLDPRYATESYQHQASAPASKSSNVVFDAASSLEAQSQPRSLSSTGAPSWQQQGQQGAAGGFTNSFSTSQSWSLSSICAIAWALPPFSSAFVLIWETENDLARFHAYQAGISGAALIVIVWILRSVLGLKTIGLLVAMGAYGWFWVNACVSPHSQLVVIGQFTDAIAFGGEQINRTQISTVTIEESVPATHRRHSLAMGGRRVAAQRTFLSNLTVPASHTSHSNTLRSSHATASDCL